MRCHILDDPVPNLATCRNIQSLSLQLSPHDTTYGWESDELGQADELRLECRDLQIILDSAYWCNGIEPFAPLFEKILCPELQNLKISDPVDRDIVYFPLGPVKAVLQKSKHLRSLWLNHISFDADVSALFAEIPLLGSLTILGLPSFPPASDIHPFIFPVSFLECLTPFHGEDLPTSALLPRLKRLELGVENPTDRFSVPAFENLVRSRWLPDTEMDDIACLQIVRSSDAPLTNELAGSMVLKGLKAAGMKVYIYRNEERLL